MSTVAASASPRVVGARSLFWLLLAGVTTQALCGVVAATFGWGMTLIPCAILASVVASMWPRAGVYLLVALAYARVSLPGLEGIYPADIVSLLVIAGTTMGRLARGESLFAHTRVNRVLAFVLIAFALSLVMAHDPRSGIVNWFRHLQLFWLMITIASCIELEDIHRLVRWVMLLTAILSVWNVVTYVIVEGGKRVFGPTGPFFPTFLAAVICQSAVCFLFAERPSRRAGWAGLWLLYTAALICSQTREVMLEVVLAMLCLFYLVWRWSSKRAHGVLKRRTITLALGLSAIIIILLSGSLSLLQGPSLRVVQAMEGRAPTIEYRMFLWKTGLRAFTDSPLLGIGLGQIRSWDEILPYWRFDPSAMITRGLGAHNDFITYIAETGLIGMGGMLVLFWFIFRMGSAKFHRARTLESASTLLMLWLPVCAILLRFFFGTHMFYSIAGVLTAFYFALLIKYTESEPSPCPDGTAAKRRD